MILCHNHPSNDLEPSPDDLDITKRIIQASEVIGIAVHEHIIISMDDDRYYSFADNGIPRDEHEIIFYFKADILGFGHSYDKVHGVYFRVYSKYPG